MLNGAALASRTGFRYSVHIDAKFVKMEPLGLNVYCYSSPPWTPSDMDPSHRAPPAPPLPQDKSTDMAPASVYI